MIALSLVSITSLLGQEVSLKQQSGVLVSLPFNETSKQEITTPVTVITGEELEKFSSTNLAEALIGRIPSGQFLTSQNGPGNTSVDMTIRGFGYLVLVDGATRSLSSLSASEVESVTILRGMTARATYGYRAKNGIILVKTKRGIAGDKSFSANVEYGVRAANENRMPKWLSSYDYSRLYNEASVNDGLDEPYSEADLAGYKQGNSLRYPDENLYNKMFNRSMQFRKANIEYEGGNEDTQYYLNMNYVGEGEGYLKDKDITYDNLRLRTNVDVKIVDFIKMKFDAIGELGFSSKPKSESAIWTAIGNYPSNAYPLVIAPDTFGTSATYPLNPYASIIKEDETKKVERSGQFNLGFEFDLRKLTQGLTASLYGTYDIYSYQDFSDRNNYTFPLFETQWLTDTNGNDSLLLKQYGSEVPDAGTTLSGNSYHQRYSANANIAYTKSFRNHNINSTLLYSLQEDQLNNEIQKIRYQDFAVAINYGYANKYYADVVLSYTGNRSFKRSERFGLFPSFGFGWIMSEENFLKDVPVIDFLKLRASYGTMGSYDIDAYFPYRNEWVTAGNQSFGSLSSGVNTSNESRVALLQLGNENIGWGKQAEFDLGVEATLLNKSLSLELDYFNIRKSGIIMSGLYPTVMGAFNLYENVGENVYKGFDGNLNYSNNISSLNYSLGFNFGYNTSEVIKDNRIQYPETWRNRVGNPVDAAYGYQTVGLFSDPTDITNSPDQSEFGTILPGNIKYDDLNNDGSISASDEKMIGHWNASYKYGINLKLAFKGFEVFAIGYGMADRDLDIRTNPYYYANSNDKYSEYVLENRWTEGKSDAALPRLTTGTSANDNRNSSYWLIDGSYFKIKNVELAYNLSNKFCESLKIKNLRFFVRGTNLATFSKIKELDPESLSSGVTTYPSFRTFTGGLAVKF